LVAAVEELPVEGRAACEGPEVLRRTELVERQERYMIGADKARENVIEITKLEHVRGVIRR
jgi:hypothetical protein